LSIVLQHLFLDPYVKGIAVNMRLLDLEDKGRAAPFIRFPLVNVFIQSEISRRHFILTSQLKDIIFRIVFSDCEVYTIVNFIVVLIIKVGFARPCRILAVCAAVEVCIK